MAVTRCCSKSWTLALDCEAPVTASCLTLTRPAVSQLCVMCHVLAPCVFCVVYRIAIRGVSNRGACNGPVVNGDVHVSCFMLSLLRFSPAWVVCCCVDWSQQVFPEEVAGLGRLLTEAEARVLATHLSSPSPTQGHPANESVDSVISKRGSNFGLPIALHLANLMHGTVGLAEVTEALDPVSRLGVVSVSLCRCDLFPFAWVSIFLERALSNLSLPASPPVCLWNCLSLTLSPSLPPFSNPVLSVVLSHYLSI